MSRRSSRRTSRLASFVSSDQEVLDVLEPSPSPRRSSRQASRRASRSTRASSTANRSVASAHDARDTQHLFSDGGSDGQIVPYEDSEEDYVLARPPPRRRATGGTSGEPSAGASPALAPATPVEWEDDTDDPDVGPSRGRKRYEVRVELPFLPLHHLEKYARPKNLSLPTKATRRRVLAEQDLRSTPTRTLPSRGVKPSWAVAPSASITGSDADYGGYVDDSEDLRDEEESERWSDQSSDDGIPRRVTRRSGRKPIEPRRTRAQRRREAPTVSDSEATSAPSVMAIPGPSSRRSGNKRQRRRSPSANASGSDFDPYQQSDGEDEIDMLEDESSRSPTPRNRVVVPTRALLEGHRGFCERCFLEPADVLMEAAQKRKKRKGKRAKKPSDEDVLLMDEEEHAEKLGGWLECERCCISSHWGCLTATERKVVLNAFKALHPDEPPIKRIDLDEVASYICARCTAHPVCFVCDKEHLPTQPNVQNGENGDSAKVGQAGVFEAVPIEVDGDSESPATANKALPNGPSTDHLIPTDPAPTLFRCFRCKRVAHYEHMRNPFPDGQRVSLPRVASHYQYSTPQGDRPWECHECREWNWVVDMIIAWRPSPPDAVEPDREEDELPNYKDRLPREYLVKWASRGFRHVTWVPHGFLYGVAPQKLRNFIERGPQLDVVTDETLAAKGDDMVAPTITQVRDDQEEHMRRHGEIDELEAKWEGHGPPPDPECANNLPVAWSTIDRILDVWLVPPKKKGKQSRRIVSSGSEGEDGTEELRDGVQPPERLTVRIGRWENMAGREITEDDADEIAPLVSWCMVKWQDLQYDQSCADTPPPKDSPLYPAFKRALRRYLSARRVDIPILNGRQCQARDAAAAEYGEPPSKQPDCVVGGQLLPFQVEGFQWLLYKYFRREGCILADDMGLGKTIQVASFLGYLCSNELQIYPSLIIVPNSTITNWVREFEKWVPHVRIVPYYGEAASRKVISKYELYHPDMEFKPQGLKAHVVLTTYDTISGSEFRVFGNVPRWEVLIVDEGQAVKNNYSLLFQRLKKVNAVHRVLLTGTPLNNNLRELFNLLNFLDEPNFRHLEELEEQFADLNEDLVVELHEMLKPYILRRVKDEVLKLPPKVEIIVPISMTPAQKHLYKRILHHHREAINSILRKRHRQRAVVAAAAEAEAVGQSQANGSHVQANGSAHGKQTPTKNGTAVGDGAAEPMDVDGEDAPANNAGLRAGGAGASNGVVLPEIIEID